MQKLFAIAVVALFAAAAVPNTSAAGNQTTHYIAYGVDGAPVFMIWCAEGGHQYTPLTATPVDHAGSPPTDGNPEEAEAWADRASGWAVSGEPECLVGDVASGNGDSGFSASAYAVDESDFGNSMTVTVTDVNFDSTYAFSRETEAAGCGPLVFDIPDDLEEHWQSTVDNPYYITWVAIYAAHVDADTTETCFGSEGDAVAIWE